MFINTVRVTYSDLLEILPEMQSGNRCYVFDYNEMNWSILSSLPPAPQLTPHHHLPATRLMYGTVTLSISGLNAQQEIDYCAEAFLSFMLVYGTVRRRKYVASQQIFVSTSRNILYKEPTRCSFGSIVY